MHANNPHHISYDIFYLGLIAIITFMLLEYITNTTLRKFFVERLRDRGSKCSKKNDVIHPIRRSLYEIFLLGGSSDKFPVVQGICSRSCLRVPFEFEKIFINALR